VAYVGCNILSGKYIIKGPTIKFTVSDSVGQTCSNDIEQWFLKLIRERVSYFGIDEKKLLLKDVAYNIVFSCSRKDEENKTSSVQK
jgi:heat shock protein HslJ